MSVKVTATLDRTYLHPEECDQVVYLLLELEAAKADSPGLRQNLSFLLDRSGSMAGEKLDYTKLAVNFGIGQLGSDDIASVIAFDGTISTLLPALAVENKEWLKQQVNRIDSGGSTNISSGMLAGFAEVQKNQGPGQVNHVLLLTDGQANVGIWEHNNLVAIVRKMAAAGVGLSTFGLGADFEEDLLICMADAGGGRFYYIQTPEQIPGFFAEELAGLLSTVAQDLYLQIMPGPGVTLQNILGYECRSEGLGLAAALPDMHSGERKRLLLEFGVSKPQLGLADLADIRLEYVGMQEELNTESVAVKIQAPVASEPPLGSSLENIEVVKQAAMFLAARAREQALERTDLGDYAGAILVLQEQAQRLRELAQTTGAKELLADAADMETSISTMESQSFAALDRKHLRTASYTRMKSRG